MIKAYQGPFSHQLALVIEKQLKETPAFEQTKIQIRKRKNINKYDVYYDPEI